MSKKRRERQGENPSQSAAIAHLTSQQRQQIVQAQVSASFSGPLPHPDILVRYNDAVPDAAERIIAMAERQSAHRIELENRVVGGTLAGHRTGCAGPGGPRRWRLSEGKPQKGRRRKKDPNYYASRAMSKAERLELSRAGQVAGLGNEIALLRKQLKAAMQAPASDKRARRDVRMLTEALEVLLKAVSVEHKVSPRAAEDLAEQLAGTLEILGGLVLPAKGEQ